MTDLQAQINDVGGSSVAAFDNSGMVFAVACSQTQTIMLYAVSSMDHVSYQIVTVELTISHRSISPNLMIPHWPRYHSHLQNPSSPRLPFLRMATTF